ncbi:MAG: hypothetical protein SFV52_05260 [Saprospiraceae bacterium]|nr:hypothetical protein [Saprospiraceae bacterium]
MSALEIILWISAVYLLVGVVFAAWFLHRGVARVDSFAQGISWITRLFLFPGTAALWPFWAMKWVKTKSAP